MAETPWRYPSEAPVIEKSVHDYVASIFRAAPDGRDVEITPISEVAESTRGWDAAFDNGGLIFYFQYKLPNFTPTPKKSTGLASDCRARKAWGYDDSEGVFSFYLREKAAKATLSQHECLLKLSEEGAPAYYLSPLFSDFKQLKRGGSLMVGDKAWLRGHVSMLHAEALWRHVVPQFSGIICFPPHCEVSPPPEDHKFIFNINREVSLHSDPTPVEAVLTLDQVFDRIADGIQQNQERVTPQNIEEYTERYLTRVVGQRHIEEVLRYVGAATARIQTSLMRRMRYQSSERLLFSSRLLAYSRTLRDITGARAFMGFPTEQHDG